MTSESAVKIAETEDFEVLVAICSYKDLNGRKGYILFNKRTGVAEAEGPSEFSAVAAMYRAQIDTDLLKSGKLQEILRTEAQQAETYNYPPLN